VSTRALLGFVRNAFGRSRVGRRVALLFIGCALLPICCLAVVAYVQVSSELRDAGARRLAQTAKTAGVEVFDKLIGLHSELDLLRISLGLDSGAWSTLPASLRERFAKRVSGLAIVDDTASPQLVFGTMPPYSAPPADAAAPMREGHSALAVVADGGGPPRIVLMRMLDANASRRMLIAEVDRDFLFSADLAPPQIEIAVLASQVPLFATLSPELSREVYAHRPGSDSSSGRFEWTGDGQSYAASFWSIPMTYDFLVPGWTIVATQASAEVLGPIRDARLSFTLIALLSLWVVMLLSSSQVRRYLVPLQLLTENTARVGRGDFDGHLDIHSGDEFEEVAASFNTMSAQLKRQFETLSIKGELDRAVLSSLDVSEIVGRVLDWLPRLLNCDGFAVIVLDRAPVGEARAFSRKGRDRASAPISELVSITPMQVAQLTSGDNWIHVTQSEGCPGYLSVLAHIPWTACTVLPIVSSNQLVGVLAMAEDGRRRHQSEDDLQVARQLADQLGVALSNASLVEALDRLNVGTLTALARTVDAKSPWTAGHSQRVTECALAIGRDMGLTTQGLDRLARGGLLHDIGKIAVPSSVLNKPGRLTAEEFDLMKQHPTIGARILEPIPDYDRLIPVVLQHHERFDGSGYPAGIAGEEISLDARIVAVADVFDALTSERPYRKAMDLAVATQIISDGSGSAFDPRVVEAFLRVSQRSQAA